MKDFQMVMNRVVQAFVAEISELARQAAIETLEAAFQGRGSLAASTGIARKGRPRGSRTGKRTARDLEVIAERFETYVRANPGLRIEQINKNLGTSTKDLALPIRKMVADGTITTKGEKRSTTYYPGKKLRH